MLLNILKSQQNSKIGIDYLIILFGAAYNSIYFLSTVY